MRRLGKYVGGGEVGADKYGTVSSFSQGKPPADISEAPSASPQYVRKSSPGMQRSNDSEGYRKGGAVKKPIRRQDGGMIPELRSVTQTIPSWARTPIDRAYLDYTGSQGSKAGDKSGGGKSEQSSSDDGKRKGGLVHKVRKYERGGSVVTSDTAPGAASASSHRWSANIKGRDVTMKAKGGKIGNLKKGRK